ncbi:recombinase family protein [Mesorhizobium sp. 1B3]|uniref:recombinase family protein n=1 Tax=Mesorhizobium sp. 1B3 TaxID=3243599 RepID=UPI003D991C34
MRSRSSGSLSVLTRDAAISGSSTILRQDIQGLMRDAQHGEFNILLAEALDRISRDQADVSTRGLPDRSGRRHCSRVVSSPSMTGLG